MDNKTNEFGQSLINSTLSKIEDLLKTTKLGNYLKFDPIKKFMHFSDIKNDAQKTNLPFALLKNTTSGTLGKGSGFVAGAGTFAVTKNPVLSTSAEIVTDAAVSTGVNKSFDKIYENTEKATKAYIKEYAKETKQLKQNNGFGTPYDGFKYKKQQPQPQPLQTKGFLNDKNKSDPWNTKEYHEFKNTADKFNESNLGYPTPVQSQSSPK